MLAHRLWMRRLIFLSLLSLVLVGLTIFMVDPLQHYRRATFYRPLWANQRYYNPGFVKHYDYDCIIIGSSMVENFIPSEVGKKLSMKVLLTPMSGAGQYEECILLNTALRTGKVEVVIWGLDAASFEGGTRRLGFGRGSMPLYLYDEDLFNDYQYLLNIDVLLMDCGRALAGNLLPRLMTDRRFDMDSAHFWGDKYEFSRKTALRSWQKPRREDRPLVMIRKPNLDSMESNFDCNVLPLVERHPEVDYYFFYPPYSILYWISDDAYRFGNLLEFKHYVYRRTRGLPNVKVFDFQDVSDITLNLDNYRDWSHHSPDVNKFIIDAISRNQCLVTDDNVEKKLNRLEDQVRKFSDSLVAAERDSAGVQQSSGDGQTGRQGGEDHEP